MTTKEENKALRDAASRAAAQAHGPDLELEQQIKLRRAELIAQLPPLLRMHNLRQKQAREAVLPVQRIFWALDDLGTETDEMVRLFGRPRQILAKWRQKRLSHSEDVADQPEDDQSDQAEGAVDPSPEHG